MPDGFPEYSFGERVADGVLHVIGRDVRPCGSDSARHLRVQPGSRGVTVGTNSTNVPSRCEVAESVCTQRTCG